MPSTQIAAQMYTLRDFTKTPAELAKTLSKVKKIGYDAVQLSAHGPIESKELANILRNEGLICCATHTKLEELRDQPQKVIEDHKLWNCSYTAIGGFFPKDPTGDDWLNFAMQYNDIAKKFDGSGVSIGYHNHNHEFARFENKTAMRILLEKFLPQIWMELDTYWIVAGGGDPIVYINELKGRVPCIHFKDMQAKSDRTQIMAEVGQGNLNWPGIVQACKISGVKWYIVEQDHCYGKDPFECLATSLRNLKAMGLS